MSGNGKRVVFPHGYEISINLEVLVEKVGRLCAHSRMRDAVIIDRKLKLVRGFLHRRPALRDGLAREARKSRRAREGASGSYRVQVDPSGVIIFERYGPWQSDEASVATVLMFINIICVLDPECGREG